MASTNKDKQLSPGDFTLLPQCAEIIDLCKDSGENRAEIARKMENIAQHMSNLRSTVAALPGISISQKDQAKVLADCKDELDCRISELCEYQK